MMKYAKILMVGALLWGMLFSLPVKCQTYEVEQLTLDWAKLATLKQILQDMKDGYQIIEKGYNTIRDISQGSFNLHNAFLSGLLSVSPVVKKYKKVAEIISMQLQIVSEYKSAYNRFRQDAHFSVDELSLMSGFFDNIFDKSLAALNSLITIITDGQIRAGDDERLRQIDGLYTEMKSILTTLRSFNNSTELLSLQRAQSRLDYDLVKKLYGIN